MLHKISKFLSFLKVLVAKPSLANLVINDNSVFEKKFREKYPQTKALPQINIGDLGSEPNASVETFFLDGSSLVTDMVLLQTLANRKDMNSYLEIGTWRGESVHNVSKLIEDCTTVNLPEEEMRSMGLPENYITQHAILSKRNREIQHIEANTKTLDFSKLSRKYDLIFIDGDHSYEMVLNDTNKVFKNLLNPNSIVVWHDYAYHPQRIRYEVFMGILDGTPKDLHDYLYHPKNTLCAVFCREEMPTSMFDEMPFPEKIYDVTVKNRSF